MRGLRTVQVLVCHSSKETCSAWRIGPSERMMRRMTVVLCADALLCRFDGRNVEKWEGLANFAIDSCTEVGDLVVDVLEEGC